MRKTSPFVIDRICKYTPPEIISPRNDLMGGLKTVNDLFSLGSVMDQSFYGRLLFEEEKVPRKII